MSYLLILGMLGLGGCAASTRHADHLQPEADALGGWRALEEGRRLEADAAFARVLTSRPGDPLALVGRAALAYERGATNRAIDDDAAALAAMVAQHSPLTVALAPLAAGQLAALYDELSVTSRGRLLQAWPPAELARSAALPWTARLELARLAITLRASTPLRTAWAGRQRRRGAPGGCSMREESVHCRGSTSMRRPPDRNPRAGVRCSSRDVGSSCRPTVPVWAARALCTRRSR